MVKKFLSTALLMLVITACLASCNQNKKEFLPYQKKPFSADATIDVNGEKYGVTITKSNADTYKISFSSPSTMNGVYITKMSGTLTYSVGGVHIPIKINSNITAEALRLFELKKSALVATEQTRLGGVNSDLNIFNTEYGGVKLYLSSETGYPLLIDADLNGKNVKLYFSRFETI